MLPNLHELSLDDHAREDTGMGLGRHSRKDVEERRRWYRELDVEREILKNGKKTYKDLTPNERKHHWQYFKVRYRNENIVPKDRYKLTTDGTELYKKLKSDPDNEIYQLMLQRPEYTMEGEPLLAPALACTIVIDSPDVYEMETHAYHWWLLRHCAAREEYHGIDEAAHKEFLRLVVSALNKYNPDKVNELRKESEEKLGKPLDDQYHRYAERFLKAESLHVGHASYHGLAFNWKVEGEEACKYVREMGYVLEDDKEKRADPRKLFEPYLFELILRKSGADMACIQHRDVTNPLDKIFGEQAIEYRVRHKSSPEYAPSCDDDWPNWDQRDAQQLKDYHRTAEEGESLPRYKAYTDIKKDRNGSST